MPKQRHFSLLSLVTCYIRPLDPTTMAEIWESNNASTTPSRTEIDETQNAIKSLLIELERERESIARAIERVEALEKDIERRRAWIAPVRKLNPDILCEIFVASSAIDWISPISLGSVCRLWRETILRSPQVWSFIQTGASSISRMSAVNLGRWLQRCGDVGLHMRIDTGSRQDHVKKLLYYAPQVTCFYNAYGYSLNDQPFPRLEQLTVRPHREEVGELNKILIYISKYSNLHTLHLHHLFTEGLVTTRPIQPLVTFPPLRNLHLSSAFPQWITILQLCASSLVSLGLDLLSQRAGVETGGLVNTIHLRQLKHLSYGYVSGLFITLVTPMLESYHVNHHNTPIPLHLDVGTVVGLIYTGPKPPDLSLFGRLERCHLDLPDNMKLAVIRTLTDPTTCPSLTTLSWFRISTSRKDLRSEQELNLIEARKAAGLKSLDIHEVVNIKQVGFKYWDVRTGNLVSVNYTNDMQCPKDLPCGCDDRC